MKKEKNCTDIFDYEDKSKIVIDKCTCCGSKKHHNFFNKDRYGYNVNTVICKSCGVIFISPRMKKNDYMIFYNEAYRKLVSCFNDRQIDKYSIQREQIIYAKSLFEFIKPNLKNKFKKINLLDVGGSTGIVSKILKEQFEKDKLINSVNVTVLDPAQEELEIAKKSGLNTINGFIEDLPMFSEKFNFIILCQTIDHLFEIKKSLNIIYNTLSEDGLFFLDIVDFKYMVRDRGVQNSIKIDHPHNFSFKATYNLLQEIGFTTITSSNIYDGHLIGFLCKKGNSSPKRYDLKEEINEILNFANRV